MVDRQHPTDWLSSSKSLSPPREARQSWTRRHKTGLGLAFAGVVAGGVLAGTLGASAATGGGPAGEGFGYGAEGAHGTPSAGENRGPRPPRGDEKPLSASLTASLKAKALTAVPGGTVDRVTSGHGDAAYEAHVTKADGTRVRALFDKNQKLLRIETGPPKGGPGKGMRGGPGGHPGGGGPEGGRPPAGGPRGGGPEGSGEAGA
jgi:hypothetical protein